MEKFHIVLDTNIYRKNPSRSDLPFQALERLCKAGIAKLHLPYIVEREFQTQQQAQYKKEIDAAFAGLDALIRKGLSPATSANIQAIHNSLKSAAPQILDNATSAITNWAASIGAESHPITEVQAKLAMESYFQGTPPLKTPKIRDDIPDAFIFQTISTLATTSMPLFVVTDDEKIVQASKDLDGVEVYKSLDELIKSSTMQSEIQDLNIADNISTITQLLNEYEQTSGNLSSLVQHNASDKLVGQQVYSTTIPDDNHEAMINGFYNPEDVEIDFDSIHYYGGGEFGIPFSFRETVTIIYYIFKHDYYALDHNAAPSVTDHNDHYYEAEDEISVEVSGVIKASFNPATIGTLTIDTVEEHICLSIDSITSIDVAES